MNIKCGKCSTSATAVHHTSVAAVKACHEGNLFDCHWAVERWIGWTDEETGYSEGDTQIVDCAAEAIATERGWTCAAGHEHVTMQARHDEGWDHAEEYGEAMAMALAGIEPRTMSGHVVLGQRSFERVA
jgi:hypothetical protein